MKRNYYQVSVGKEGMSENEGRMWAIRKAKARKRKVETGQWIVKRIGQTPTNWVYRVQFQSSN